MKLDESVIKEIQRKICQLSQYDLAEKVLKELDLIFKPGDSSHSVLVENKPKELTPAEIYDKRK